MYNQWQPTVRVVQLAATTGDMCKYTCVVKWGLSVVDLFFVTLGTWHFLEWKLIHMSVSLLRRASLWCESDGRSYIYSIIQKQLDCGAVLYIAGHVIYLQWISRGPRMLGLPWETVGLSYWSTCVQYGFWWFGAVWLGLPAFVFWYLCLKNIITKLGKPSKTAPKFNCTRL